MHECARKLDNKILMSENNTTNFIKEIWNHKNTKDNKFKDININSDKKKDININLLVIQYEILR